jgi:hypothetical protein
MGENRKPDESELRMSIENNPIAKVILDVLNYNEVSEKRPANVYAIAAYMPDGWGGDVALLEELLDGLADACIIGVDTNRWKDLNAKWYFQLGPLEQLARIKCDS